MAGEYTQEKYNRDVKANQGIQIGLKTVGGLLSMTGVGTIPGILLNLGTSLFGGIASRSLQKKAESATVPLQNFQQQQFLNQLQEQRRALQTGTANMAQQEAIQQQGALATQNALRASGGDIGTAIWALNRINRSTGRGLNELYSGMSGQAMQMMGLLGQTTQAMANREYQIKGMDRAQKLAEATQARKDFGENLMGTLKQLTGNLNLSNLLGQRIVAPTTVTPPITNLPQINLPTLPTNNITYGTWNNQNITVPTSLQQNTFPTSSAPQTPLTPSALSTLPTFQDRTNSLFTTPTTPTTQTPYNGVLAPQTTIDNKPPIYTSDEQINYIDGQKINYIDENLPLNEWVIEWNKRYPKYAFDERAFIDFNKK